MTELPRRRAPFAEEIREISPRATVAGAAAVDLARTLGLDAGSSAAVGGLEGELVADLIAPWLAPGATIHDLRQHLRPLAAEAPALQARLRTLRHDQHEALHHPQWADVVDEINRLSAQLADVRAALAAAHAERLAIEHLLTGLQATEGAAPEAIRASFAGLLDALGVTDPAPGITPATDWLKALTRHLLLRRPIVDLTWTTLTATTDSLFDDLAEILG